jgi:calmodulin
MYAKLVPMALLLLRNYLSHYKLQLRGDCLICYVQEGAVSIVESCVSGRKQGSDNVVLLRFLGTIELHELQQVMRKLGQNPTEAELIEMISSVDDNGDNEIDFEEFLLLMKSRIGERDPEKELRDAFAVFDTDGSGSIDRKELKRLMKKLGQALTEAELDAMMDEVDTNGDGEISFAEFKAMMVSSREFPAEVERRNLSYLRLSRQFSNLNFLWAFNKCFRLVLSCTTFYVSSRVV